MKPFDQACFPIFIIQDRYTGTYSKGEWLAFAHGDRDHIIDLVMSGAFGGDVEAMIFWYSLPAGLLIASGHTPDEALAALKQKYITSGES